MHLQIREIWRQTRTLPPDKRHLVDQLFSEIEHTHQQDEPKETQTYFNYEFKFNNTKSNYYQPRWFSESSSLR